MKRNTELSTDDTDGHREEKKLNEGTINRRGSRGPQRKIDIEFLLAFLCGLCG
jgi:hypothetical protein